MSETARELNLQTSSSFCSTGAASQSITPHEEACPIVNVHSSNTVNAHCVLLRMPLDIIHEIFRHLYPIDLLRLSRTNKTLRGQLLSRRRSEIVWRTARRNIKGLPDCPAYMSEPAYANLAFNPYCHICFKSSSRADVAWEFKTRYCCDCQSSRDVIWHVSPTRSYFERTLGKDSGVDWRSSVVCYSRSHKLYQKTACEQFAQKVLELRDDPHALDVYTRDMQSHSKLVAQHAKACIKWYKQFLEKRLQDIIARLRGEGWGIDLDEMSKGKFAFLRSDPIILLPNVLSDHEWEQIRDYFTAEMQNYREARLRRERPALIHTRLFDLHQVVHKYALGDRRFRTVEQEYGPKFSDIALMPEIRALVEAPSDVEMQGRDFQRACSQLPTLTEQFDAKRRGILASMLAQRLGRWAPDVSAVDTDVLDLAVAWFHCETCKTYLRVPGVFAHRCQRQYVHDTDPKDFKDRYVYDVAKVSRFHAWSETDLRPIIDEDLASLIVACGLDPDTATAAQLDSLDVRLTCTTPPSWRRRSDKKLVMNWRRAVLSLPALRECETVGWERVSDDDKRRALPIEKKAREATLDEEVNQMFLQCAVCDESWWSQTSSHGDRDLVLKHLRNHHGIPLIVRTFESGKYIYTHPDGIPETPAVWIPVE